MKKQFYVKVTDTTKEKDTRYRATGYQGWRQICIEKATGVLRHSKISVSAD